MATDSTDQEPEPIICAIGDDGSPAALAVAGREAQRTGSRLHLVHVSADPHGRQTDALLLDAMVRLHASHPGLAVTRDIISGDWIAAGLERAGHARYVVIERTRQGRLHRLLSGSTANGTAFRVSAPVLSVPTGWHDAPASAVVTVAVQDRDEVPALVGLAATEATARGVGLVVLHAASPERSAGVDGPDDWLGRAHHQLEAPVRDATELFPDLEVRLEVTADRPIDAVVGAAAGSSLLVLGRRHHEHAWGTNLGPVVRRALLDAGCPVLLAPDVDIASRETPEHVVEALATGAHGLVPGDVLVAVGEDDAGGAVRFAVAEAAARGVGVHLVHVARMPDTDGAYTAEAWRDAVSHGTDVLERAAAQARTLDDTGIRLSQRLIEQGALVRSLVAAGAQAGVIVVQHRRLGPVRRLVTWSVTNGVAARCDVPVIAVPADWSAGPERVGCVVVGLQDRGDLEDVLPTGLDEAARRGLPLRVVHAGPLSTPEHEAMVADIEAARTAHPDVTIHRVFEDRYPVDLLVGAVTTAELVVVGRRRHGLSKRSHLGPVARDVLDRSPFPVLLSAPVG